MARGMVQVLKDELRVPEPGNDGSQSTEDVIRARIAPASGGGSAQHFGWRITVRRTPRATRVNGSPFTLKRSPCRDGPGMDGHRPEEHRCAQRRRALAVSSALASASAAGGADQAARDPPNLDALLFTKPDDLALDVPGAGAGRRRVWLRRAGTG